METMNFLCKGRTGFFPIAGSSSHFQSQRAAPDPNAMDIGAVNETWDESKDEDKEMLSVIRSLEQWQHYLEGVHYQFEIWNDHANLQWFIKYQDLNRRQARWAQYVPQPVQLQMAP